MLLCFINRKQKDYKKKMMNGPFEKPQVYNFFRGLISSITLTLKMNSEMKRLARLLMFTLSIVIFVSCEEEDEHGLTAVAGPDQEVSVGQTVTLNSGESIDLTGEGFTSTWSFSSLPEGSNATLNNANSETATFTPDVAGDYQINLTISNGLGESSDGLVVTAAAAGTMEISGSYNDDLHLMNIVEDPDVPDYLVTGDITVSAHLIIDPGVRIAVMSDNRIRITSDGVLDAQGTEDEPIVITGNSELPGYWKGVILESNNLENEINHVHISYAGSNIISSGRPRTGLHVESGRLNISNSSFTEIDGYGLSVRSSDSRIPMNNNHFQNNNLGAVFMTAGQIRDIDEASDFNNSDIVMDGSNVQLSTDHTWKAALNGRYRFSDDINIYDNINIEEGAVFAADNDVRIYFREDAILRVSGTSANPVIFKGSLEQAGSWRGIFYENSSLEGFMEHVQIAHAGHSNLASGFEKTALGLASSARLSLSNVHFSEIDGYGIYIRYDGTGISIVNSHFGQGIAQAAMHIRVQQIAGIDTETDFGNNYVEVQGSSLDETENVTWPKLKNGTYLFNGSSDISGQITLQPGTVLEFDNDARLRIINDGVIVANGTASENIIFTRKSGSASHWKGLAVESSRMENSMEYVEISYAGNSNLISGIGQTNLGLGNSARLTLTNSTISNSLGYGIDVRSSAELTESGNTFSDNANDDVNYQ